MKIQSSDERPLVPAVRRTVDVTPMRVAIAAGSVGLLVGLLLSAVFAMGHKAPVRHAPHAFSGRSAVAPTY